MLGKNGLLGGEEKKRERKRKIEESLMALHKRLGHPSSEVLFEVCKKYSLVENFPQLRDLCNVVRKCEPCLLGKAKRIAHPAKSPNVSSTPGERISTIHSALLVKLRSQVVGTQGNDRCFLDVFLGSNLLPTKINCQVKWSQSFGNWRETLPCLKSSAPITRQN